MARVSDSASCMKCHEKFKKEDMYEISKGKWICNPCNKERESYEYFSNEIKKVFNLKAPGPRINATRAKLISLGFSDKDIIEALYYCLNTKRFSTEYETIGFITPELLKEIEIEKRKKDYEENILIEAMAKIEYVERFVPRYKENKKERDYNINNLLGDDVI